MKKDVIYIDTEDDITAIIGKVKDASAKIVALVPPKRIGVLQSAVNLKLLQKSATTADKRIVLITNDHSLTSLAAGVKVPVAKNLQSRPEVPEIAALQPDDDEVINGEELPVGELAAAAGQQDHETEVAEEALVPSKPERTKADDIADEIEFAAAEVPAAASAPSVRSTPVSSAKKDGKKIKVPNFNSFRKKLFIVGGILLVAVPLFIWGTFIAPKAKVVITAKTSNVNVDHTLSISPSLATDAGKEQFKAVNQELKKSVSVDFTPTGTKEIGDKAAGTITVSNASESNAITMDPGTQFIAAGGQKFVSTASVVVPGAKVSGGSIQAGVASVPVQAAALGPEYNVAAQSYTIQGYSQLAANGQQMSGGSRQTVTVVTEDDVTKARERLDKQDTAAAENEISKQFSSEFAAIADSFEATDGTPVASPAVGEQGSKAKLTVETTYSMLGLTKDELKELITQDLQSALKDKPDQAVIDDGQKSIKFEQYQKFDDGSRRLRLLATGIVGPRIKTQDLAKQLTGRRYGEIEQTVKGISGVEKVDIQFSPFWVNKAPSNPQKINITFSVVNDK